MGPYYRGTSHGVGALFDFLHQNPLLMLGIIALVAAGGYYYWRKAKRQN